MQRTGGLSAAATLMGMVAPEVKSAAWAGGSDRPEKTAVRIGFIPLTDCAAVVIAGVKNFDKKYGISITPARESSWAGVRDKLVSGDLDASHALYGLVYGVHMGIGSPRKDMAVLMTLSNNGQGITLSNHFKVRGATDGSSLARLVHSEAAPYTFAQTFPTGTHAMWLYYWLASHGVHPFKDTRIITVPPPQMVASLRSGDMHGYCVGDPWNARAIEEGIGFTVATSQEIWPDHPEKVLGATREFVERYPNTARAMIMAILDASKYIDTMSHRSEVAQTLARKSYVNADVGSIESRMLGQYDNGLGQSRPDRNFMKFYGDGAVTFPYLSDAMWFLTQHRRWGLLKEDPDYLAIAREVNQTELYREAAAQLQVALPASEMRSSTLIDGVLWDGSNPRAYANSFPVHA